MKQVCGSTTGAGGVVGVLVVAFAQLVACNDGSATTDAVTSTSSTSLDTSTESTSPLDESSGQATTESSAGTSSSSTTSDEGLNALPQTFDDLFHVPAETPLDVAAAEGVLANDHDPEGDTLSIVGFDALSENGGTVDVAADGSFTYTPPPSFWGPDRFGYTATDLDGATNSAEAVINVTPVQMDLFDLLNGDPRGFVITGGPQDRFVGFQVAGLGDMDDDGLGEILLGAGHRDDLSGGAYVVRGAEDLDAVDLEEVAAGAGGFVMINQVVSIETGTYARPAGDVDGDGHPDVVLGGLQNAANAELGEIRSYVVFGKADDMMVDLDDVIAGVGGFTIAGDAQLQGADPTMFVDGIGDLDADGHDDILVGVPAAATGASRTYVIYGSADTTAIDLAAIAAGDGGFAVDGEVGAYPEYYRTAALGDVNEDGYGDFAIVDPSYDNRGRVYVVLGDPAASTIELADVATGVGGYVIDGVSDNGQVGWSIARSGDVDGDGRDDFVVTAQSWSGPDTGSVYVLFGKDDTDAVSLADVDAGVGGFVIHGESGTWIVKVGGGGDFDGDGHPDIAIISADMPDTENHTRAYLVYGTAETTPIELADVAEGQGGFVLYGEAGSAAIEVGAVGIATDLDGDGLDELMVGNPTGTLDAAHPDVGRVYVVRGVSRAPY